ncbi:uncharacterized protein LOC113659134 isoform X4 [Tachysurus ichikawai]
MQIVFGILLMFTGAASGSLFQDYVVCRFDQSYPCYVALGQRLHLQMPLEDGFDLKTTSLIIKYRTKQSYPPTPLLSRWQFVNDNKTMILTSAERSDSGTYTLNIFDGEGGDKGSSTLQVNIEARVSSVTLSYSCMFPQALSQSHIYHMSSSGDAVTLPILGSVCVILIVLVVLAFYIYKKRQSLKSKEEPSQDGKDLVYAKITHSAISRTETRPTPVQNEGVEYGTVVTSNQKKKEDDVQYGELVFNTPAQKKSKPPKVQEECVYSGVQHSQ